MNRLLIMRHAKSSRDIPDMDDHERPLNERGERDAPRMGKHLQAMGIQPDLIVSSTAVRALRTAQLFADGNGYTDKIETDKHLYMAEVEDYLKVLKKHSEAPGEVMIVTHNPGAEELLEYLTGESRVLRTCSVAVLELANGQSDHFGRHSAKLTQVETPKHDE